MGAKSQTIGYTYFMGVHFGLCHGPIDELVSIRVGGRVAWQGAAVGNQTIQLNADHLFGGEKKEGGIVGPFELMMGGATQGANAYLASQQVGFQLAYRGLVTAVYRGQIAAMNPYPKPWGFRVRRWATGWTGPVWNPTKAMISMDGGQIKAMNPAHMVYQAITDPEWGMGYPESSIDLTVLTATALQLFNEGFGLCLKWNKTDSIENWLQIIADHVAAVISTDRNTGKFRMDLIRDDYVFANLPIFGPDNVLEMEEFEPPSLEDSTNELTVVYRDPLSNKDGAITLQSLASVQTQGRIVNEKREYPGLPTGELAGRVALRDLRSSSVGLKRVTLRVNRQAYDLRPGQAIRFQWPQDGLDIAMRVGQVEYGTLKEGSIKFVAIEDVFGLPDNTYVRVQDPGWVAPVTTATNMTVAKVREAAYLDLAREMEAGDFAAVAVGTGRVMTYGPAPTSMSQNYGVFTRTGANPYVEEAVGDFCATGYLAEVVGQNDTVFTLQSIAMEDLLVVGALADMGDELVRIDAFNTTTKEITVGRGVGDTVPKPHAINVPFYVYGTYNGFVPKEYLDGESVSVKLLTRTSTAELLEASATTRTVVMDERFDRPYPPGNVKVNNAYFPVDVNGPVALTWAHRDRISQDDQLISFTATSIGPEVGVTYTVRVLNGVGTAVRTVSGLTGTSWTYTDNDVVADGQLQDYSIELYSVRAGLNSWQRQLIALERHGLGFRLGEELGS